MKKLNVFLFMAIIIGFGLLNIFFHERSEISQVENRKLATFPEFEKESFWSGKYFRDIEAYYSDRFIGRDFLVSTSKKISNLKGIKGNDGVEIISLETEDQFAENVDPANQEKLVKKEQVPRAINKINDIDKRILPFIKEDIKSRLSKDSEEKNLVDKNVVIEDNEDLEGQVRKNFLVVGDAAYELFGYSEKTLKYYADAINLFKANAPEGTRVFSLMAPSPIEFIPNKKYRSMSKSQEEAYRVLTSYLDEGIISVDARSHILPHYKEYLYFRSDHHWTARGAYYAYEAFIEEAGYAPVTLDKYERKEFPGFLGSMYRQTNSEAIKKNPDTVEVFMPIVENKYKIYSVNGSVFDWNVINLEYGKISNKYLMFISGDNPLGIITTNADTDRKILVSKDSYGNAFIPYLINHYKEIHIIDPREYNKLSSLDKTMVEYVKENEIEDVLFLNYSMLIGTSRNFSNNMYKMIN